MILLHSFYQSTIIFFWHHRCGFVINAVIPQWSSFQLEFGVSQESVFKPLLYSLFAKPMCDTCRKHNLSFKCHADYTQLHTTITATSNWINITSCLQICVLDTSWNTRIFFKIKAASALTKKSLRYIRGLFLLNAKYGPPSS